MADKGEESSSDETSISRIRSHVTITRAQPLLLEEVASLADGLRSARITSLANLGLLVERGFFSGEFFHALQAPEVQKALMGFRATNALLDSQRSAASQVTKLAGAGTVNNSAEQRSSSSVFAEPELSDKNPSINDIGSNELEPGRGVIVEQSRPPKTVRMQ